MTIIDFNYIELRKLNKPHIIVDDKVYVFETNEELYEWMEQNEE